MQSSAKFLQPPASPFPLKQTQSTATTRNLQIPNHCCKFSRRELAIGTSSSLLLLLGSQALEPLNLLKTRAEEQPDSPETIQLPDNPDTVQLPDNPDTLQQPDNPDTLQQPENSDTLQQPDNPNAVQLPENPDTLQQPDNPDTIQQPDNPEKTELPDSPDKIEPKEASREIDYCVDQNVTKKAFLEVSVDGEPMGRIVIGLYGDSAPFGSAMFSKLVSGAAGVSYRRKEFVRIMPSYVQHGGLRSFGVDAELAKNTGKTMALDNLVNEWEKLSEKCSGTKNVARSVSIIVKDPSKPPPKLKLVARKGKLEIDQEEVGKDVNGTEFTIALKDSPELDASALVIGRVLDGMDVVERIGQVKTVKENTSSPYFRVAKLIGDKRAVVAERGFNRPYSKVVITNCGLIE